MMSSAGNTNISTGQARQARLGNAFVQQQLRSTSHAELPNHNLGNSGHLNLSHNYEESMRSTPHVNLEGNNFNGGNSTTPQPSSPHVNLEDHNFGGAHPSTPHVSLEDHSFGGGPGGGHGGPGPGEMQVFHTFNNNEDKDISINATGGIASVTSEGKTAKDGLNSTDFSAKHYRIRFASEYSDIRVYDPGPQAAAGAKDPGISVARVVKESPSVFNVWFNRSSGFNTYVNQFSIDGRK